MSSAILLRTLARKSVLDFGKYKDRSIQQIIDLGNVRTLRWYYYNLSMISYLPDILDEIGITQEWRIEKPGKDPEKGESLDAVMDAKIAAFNKAAYESSDVKKLGKIMHYRKYLQKRKKSKEVQFTIADEKQFSKGNMQWKNQGH